MPTRVRRWIIATCIAVALGMRVAGAPSVAQAPATAIAMNLDVDASHVTAGIIHVHERIPVSAGPLTLVYPKWIPGEHAPAGPIVNLASIVITAGTYRLRWERDLVDAYQFHVDVPPGTAAIDVRFNFLGAAIGRYSSARLATANMLSLTWNKVVLTPMAADYRTIMITPALTLPGADWLYATALDTTSHAGAAIAFAPVTLETLVDSPLDAGTNMRRWPLGTIDGAPVDLAVFADSPEQLDGDAVIPKFRNLVTQMAALYRARHFNHYTFLLTVSDVLPPEGVEHHQSSDNGSTSDFLIDKDRLTANADLLPHEFNHSWDGKYRRPGDLATPNMQVPMRDDLLWVYEGMTQFYGYLQAERSGLLTEQQWLDHLALTYARLDAVTGRTTNPLYDTAAAAPVLYFAPQAFSSERRGTDFYSEGELMWLDADVTIRRLSGGRRSIDDFSRAFFGRTSTGPEVVPFARADVIAALNAVQPYDWASFFQTHIDAIALHPPDPFSDGGWRVTFAPKPSALEKLANKVRKSYDAQFSLGIVGGTAGMVNDVIDGSPAQRAGVAPGDKIVAIDGRATEGDSETFQEQLDASLVRAQHGGPAVRMLLLGGGTYRDVAIPYEGGPRFPNVERVAGIPDRLSAVAMRARPLKRNAEQLSGVMPGMGTDFRNGRDFPRRARHEIDGFLWLARVFDKARAAQDETLHDYIYPCPMDRGVFDRWGITSRMFDAALDSCNTDDGILAWIRARVTDERRNDANRWLLEEKGANLDRLDAEEGFVPV